MGVYWQSYGWVAPGESVSGLEDEYRLAAGLPKLIYVKALAPDRQPLLVELLGAVKADDEVSYRSFGTAVELGELVENDLALLLTERFEQTLSQPPVEASPISDAVDTIADSPSAGRSPPAPLVKPITPLVGRQAEVRQVLDLLQAEVRLITLVGPGGIGKTRIALAVADQVQESGTSEVTWVTLAGTREPRLVPSAIASAMGLPENPRQSVLDSVCAHLAGHRHLLVLDNFEQVLAAAPTVTEILQRCPDAVVLVASRSVLNVRGEHDLPVQPLPVPASDGAVSDAMSLFEARARAVSPGFAVTPDNAATVAEICRRLDGLPLAIELAAARVRLLPLDDLLGRLDTRLKLLTVGPRDLPERHRTLRATLDWDYDLLDDDERATFRRLSVFAGGCTLDAADAVDGALGGAGTDLLDRISSLINKSLIRLDVGGSGQPRFVMLETIREYAHEMLVASGEEQTAHAAHGGYFAGYVGTTFLRGTDQVDQLGLLEDDHSNFRIALERAVAGGDLDLELLLVAELAPFWEVHGHLREGAARVAAALRRSEGRQDRARARVALASVIFDRVNLDFEHARAMAEQARSIGHDLGDDELVAWALKDLGVVSEETGRQDEAQEYAKEAIALFDRVGEELGGIRVLNNLAVSYTEVGRYDDAVELLQQTYERFRRRGDAVGATRSFQNIGLAKLVAGDPDLAARFLIRALARFLQLGSTWDVADCLDFVASALAASRRFEDAAVLVGASESLRSRIGAPRPDHVVDGYTDASAVLADSLTASRIAAAIAVGQGLTLPDLPTHLATIAEPRLVDLADDRVEAQLLAGVSVH